MFLTVAATRCYWHSLQLTSNQLFEVMLREFFKNVNKFYPCSKFEFHMRFKVVLLYRFFYSLSQRSFPIRKLFSIETFNFSEEVFHPISVAK